MLALAKTGPGRKSGERSSLAGLRAPVSERRRRPDDRRLPPQRGRGRGSERRRRARREGKWEGGGHRKSRPPSSAHATRTKHSLLPSELEVSRVVATAIAGEGMLGGAGGKGRGEREGRRAEGGRSGEGKARLEEKRQRQQQERGEGEGWSRGECVQQPWTASGGERRGGSMLRGPGKVAALTWLLVSLLHSRLSQSD